MQSLSKVSLKLTPVFIIFIFSIISAMTALNSTENRTYTAANDNETNWNSTYIDFALFIGPISCAIVDTVIVVAYVAVWERHTRYGWSILAMTVSLLLFYAGVATLPMISLAAKLNLISFDTLFWFCYSSIITIQFSFVSSYTWALVMAFHIWRSLWTLSRRSNNSQATQRFLLYIAFGYGIPFALTTMSLAIFNSTHGDFPYSCFGYIQFFRYWFVYVPVGIIFLCNMVLMGLTIFRLWQAKRNRAELRVHHQNDSSASQSVYSSAILITKLMVLMGAFLALDMVIHFLDASGIGESAYSVTFEYLYRFAHSICLFWIFVCNNDMLEKLSSKYPMLAEYLCQKSKIDEANSTMMITVNVTN